jgi:hypothetical protein
MGDLGFFGIGEKDYSETLSVRRRREDEVRIKKEEGGRRDRRSD